MKLSVNIDPVDILYHGSGRKYSVLQPNNYHGKHGVEIPVRVSITVFWLPIATRPADFPPMKFKRGTKFWHIGIIYQSTTYECFNHGRQTTGDRKRIKELEQQQMVSVDTTGDLAKLTSELTSGTDCATYVARVLGLCTTTGSDKGPWWPDDIYTKLTKRK